MIVPAVTWKQAPPAVRDRFLNALDRHDAVAIDAAAMALLGCENSLPGETCRMLGLAPGSTYGDAAAAVAASKTPVEPSVATGA